MKTLRRIPTKVLRDSCLEKLADKMKPGLFLEIGPGEGDTTELFLNRGFKGICFDISDESRDMLAINLKKYQSEIKIINNLDTLEKGIFDYIFLFDVIEHIDSDYDTLRKFTEYLKPNGMLLISVPAHKKLFGRSDELMGHFRRYEKNELMDLLVYCQYKEIEILNYGFPLLNLTLKTINLIYRFLGNRDNHYYEGLSIDERTKKSGIRRPQAVRCLLFMFNGITMLPFIYLQRLFLKTDWGVAYIAYARK